MFFLAVATAAAFVSGCGDREPAAREQSPAQPLPAAPTQSAAEITGWPQGLGRALVLRLGASQDAYRIVVPEFGDARFADSALSVRVADSLFVSLLGPRGKTGDARALITDAEAGTGSCVTWPSVEIAGAQPRSSVAMWRIALERDSVTAIPVDSLTGMASSDSAALASAVHSVLHDAPGIGDSTLRGLPFSILRAYSLRAGGRSIVVGELSRNSSSEADPREQRLFVVGERGADEQTHRLVYSHDATGAADVAPVTDLLAAVVSRASGRPILIVGVEGRSGMRLQLIQRVGRGQWRRSWTSVVTFC